MTLNTLIFSNELKHRLARHLAFWLIFSLHFVIQNLMIGGPGEGKTSRTFMQSFFHFLYFLPFYLLATYLFIQVLLPRFFFRRKYAVFCISFLLLFALQFIAIYYAGLLYINHTSGTPISKITFNANKYFRRSNRCARRHCRPHKCRSDFSQRRSAWCPRDRKSTRLNSSHGGISRMPSSA